MKLNYKLLLTTIGFAIVMQLNTVAYAYEPYYSLAVASPIYNFGESDNRSWQESDNMALDYCEREANVRCHIAERFEGASCVAVAIGADDALAYSAVNLGYSVVDIQGWGGGGAAVSDAQHYQIAEKNLAIVKNDAMDNCNSKSYNCKLDTAVCFPLGEVPGEINKWN